MNKISSRSVTDEEVLQMREEYYSKTLSKQQLIDKYKITRRGIESILKGESYSHLPFDKDKYYSISNQRIKININDIKELYDQGLSSRQIGKELNCDHSTVLYHIKKLKD